MQLLLPFSDDSTLFFANKLSALLKNHAPDVRVDLAAYLPEMELSERQMALLLPQGPDLILDGPAFSQMARGTCYDAIITCRVYRRLKDLLQEPIYRKFTKRPRIVAFLGGLEFFPQNALTNRQFCDIVFLTPQTLCHSFHAQDNSLGVFPDYVGFGHPAFLRTKTQERTGCNIYFFAQAISPKTRRSRAHIVDILAAMARRHPDRQVYIKLRHQKDENRNHLHVERHSYESLFAALGDERPDNLATSSCDMQTAITDAAYGITCTSTAAFDLIAARVPTAIYLDYLDLSLDPLNAPMRAYFEESGLIKQLEALLLLEMTPPRKTWLNAFVRSSDELINDLLGALR